jgi:Arc/MetJ family transcription regulator
VRTSIDIDDELLSQAMSASGQKTKKATVEDGLRLLIRLAREKQAGVALRGVGWEGDLDEMRERRRF